MLGTLLGCSCFLIYHPLEGVCCNIVLGAAGAFMPVLVGVSFPLAGIAVGMIAAGCRNRTGFHDIAALGAFLMLRTGCGRRCCGVGDPVAGGMCCFLGLYAAGTFRPVLISIGLPLAGIAVGMIAAGCRNRTGFHDIAALGAFLMLRTSGGRRCCGVGDPVAGGMCCFLGLYAAGTFKPVLISTGLPLAGIAVGMIAVGCRNRTGFHDIAALGAFLMLRTGGGRRCCGVGDPVAGGMCCFLGLYAAGTFKPVLISTGLPLAAIAVGMIAAGRRDRIGFQYALADGAFLMLRTVSGSRCSGVDDPVAGGMSGLSVPENRPAAIHFAYFPMVRCIRLPLAACNMGRYLTDMFIGPVIFPFVAHHTAAMVTACRNAVCFTAILAQTAEFADRTAFGAGLTALHTNSRAVFAGVAAFTQGSAVGAIFLTILAQGRAVTATPAVMAQRGAVFTGAAIGAEHAAFTAVGAAAFADGRAISAVFFAPTAQRYTVFTITAILTQLGAVCTGAAIGADGTALTAGTAADGADLSAGCTVIAGLAETLRLLQTFLTSGAVLVLIDGAFNAHFAVCADITACTVGTQ